MTFLDLLRARLEELLRHRRSLAGELTRRPGDRAVQRQLREVDAEMDAVHERITMIERSLSDAEDAARVAGFVHRRGNA